MTAPDLPGALCVTSPDRDYWTSEDPNERAEAAKVCRHCPVLIPCRNWALSLPPGFVGVLGGILPGARRRAA